MWALFKGNIDVNFRFFIHNICTYNIYICKAYEALMIQSIPYDDFA